MLHGCVVLLVGIGERGLLLAVNWSVRILMERHLRCAVGRFSLTFELVPANAFGEQTADRLSFRLSKGDLLGCFVRVNGTEFLPSFVSECLSYFRE